MSTDSTTRALLQRFLHRLRQIGTFDEALCLAAMDMPRPTEREYAWRVNLIRFLSAFRREAGLGRLTLARTDDLAAFSTEEARAYLAMLDRFRRAGEIRDEDVARVRLRLRGTRDPATNMGRTPPATPTPSQAIGRPRPPRPTGTTADRST